MANNKKVEVLLGNEAIVRGALEAGVGFVSGYPGCPAAEIGDEMGKIAAKNGIYAEISTNEKVALETAMGASYSGVRALVNMKSFGINVCSDALLPLAYTGTKGAMVIVVADDPSCWSSAQSEQDSRGYAYLSHIPMLEPADAKECYEFTKLGFEISEKFKTPVILRTTTRVAHQRMPVEFSGLLPVRSKGEFVKDKNKFVTMPPRTLGMKKELIKKTEEIKKFLEKSKINSIEKGAKNTKLGIIVSGVSYLHTKEALAELKLDLPILKLGLFYPLPENKIKSFVKDFKKVLVIEELEGYLEKEVTAIAKDSNCKLEIFGKDVLPTIGELSSDLVAVAISKILKIKFKAQKSITSEVPRRFPRLCVACPYWFVFSAVKKLAPEGTIFGGDIGCYMIGGYPPHNLHDYMICMGSSTSIAHGIIKSTKQKVITFMGDSGFFHSGIPAIINAVYNKSNPLIIILENRITAMTGHQPNPDMGKTSMGEDAPEINISEVVRALGVKNVKVAEPKNMPEFESAVKEFIDKDEVSVIVAKQVCTYWYNKQMRNKS
jgi:indolepyruvate ferredoxin oxidoreductase alpha subunit